MSAAQTTYVTAIRVDDLFADPLYQRELDTNRARSMSLRWDPSLVGVIDVSDRGDGTPSDAPRYAIINGQHRWRAAIFLDPTMSLVCNVHTGLTVADEAKLFKEIDERTKKISTWDRWKARRAAGDPTVLAIDTMAESIDLVVTNAPGVNHIQCCAALEFIYDRCLPEIVLEVLTLVNDLWPNDPKRHNPAILKGLALALFDYSDRLDDGRFADALSEVTPNQLIARAHELKAALPAAGIPKLVTHAAITAYNRASGRGTRILLPA